MMNEELFNKCKTMESLKEDYNKFIDDYGLLCNDFVDVCEENTKLKAEIEQLKHQIKTRIKVSEANFDIYSKLEIERDNLVASVEQLKSELEQSVKLPYTCDNCKYADFIGVDFERFYCMNHGRYMNVCGYCSFGEREEAEQSLKNKINDKQLEAIIEADNVKKDFKEFCDKRDKEESKLKFREVK